MQNLAPMLQDNLQLEFFTGKMENFLTCRALATYLKENVIGEERGALVENLALQAIHSTMLTKVSVGDSEMLFSELPNILKCRHQIHHCFHHEKNLYLCTNQFDYSKNPRVKLFWRILHAILGGNG